MQPMPHATRLKPHDDAGEQVAPRRLAGRLALAAERNVFVALVLAACCVLHAAVVHMAVISDAWYTLLAGRSISASGLPHHDTWTLLTLGHRWVDQQWLGQLGLYGLWNAGGWRLAATGVVVLYVAAFAVAVVAARRGGASDRNVAAAGVVCFVAGLNNTVFRAQIPTYVLFELALVLLLAEARQPSRRVYLVFPLLALWANIHGSVVLGAALVALLGLVEAAGRLRARHRVGSWLPRAGLLVVAPWACTLVSPYGLGLPGYYRSVLGNSTLSHSVSEWAESTVRGEPIFFVLFVAAVWLLGRAGGAMTPFAKLALAGCGFLGLLAVRNVVWFALVGAAVLPAALDAVKAPSQAPRRTRFNVALASTAVVVAVGAVASVALHGRSWFERRYPPRAAAAVSLAARSDPSLKVFANERYADWLMVEDPALVGRVAYDVRFELLSNAQLDKIVTFRTEHGVDWQRAANGYGLLVLQPGADGGAIELFRRAGARVLYRDGKVVVLRRQVSAAGT
jgi:hypothetical protein